MLCYSYEPSERSLGKREKYEYFNDHSMPRTASDAAGTCLYKGYYRVVTGLLQAMLLVSACIRVIITGLLGVILYIFHIKTEYIIFL